MIVKDEDIEKSLDYMNIEPHPVAKARHDLTLAENKVELIFAELYPVTEGSVKERECDIERNIQYRDAKIEYASALMELERHKAKIRAAEMLISVWQSDGANRRAAEKVY